MTHSERGSVERIFLDSSVFVAATLSTTGGSFRLCREAHSGRIRLVANRYIEHEVERVLGEKYPEALPLLRHLMDWTRVEIRANPPPRVVKRYLDSSIQKMPLSSPEPQRPA